MENIWHFNPAFNSMSIFPIVKPWQRAGTYSVPASSIFQELFCDLGGISSSILSVFFTDKFDKLLKSLHLIGWEQICQWKTLTKCLMKCPPVHYEPTCILDLDEQLICAIGVHNSGNTFSHSTRYGINCWILQLTSDYTGWRDCASDVCKSIITVVSVSTLKEISWIMGNPDCFWVIFLNWKVLRQKIPSLVKSPTPKLRKSLYVVQIAIFCSFAGI